MGRRFYHIAGLLSNFFSIIFHASLTQSLSKVKKNFLLQQHHFLQSVKEKITLILLVICNHFAIINIRITENALKNIGRGRGDNLNFGYENKNDIKELEKSLLYKLEIFYEVKYGKIEKEIFC